MAKVSGVIKRQFAEHVASCVAGASVSGIRKRLIAMDCAVSHQTLAGKGQAIVVVRDITGMFHLVNEDAFLRLSRTHLRPCNYTDSRLVPFYQFLFRGVGNGRGK